MKKIQKFIDYTNLYNKIERYINDKRNNNNTELDKFNLILQLFNNIEERLSTIVFELPPQATANNLTPVYTGDTYIGTALIGTSTNQVFTASANGALGTLDGYTYTIEDINKLVLLDNQTNPVNNGLYVITAIGGVSGPYILTRASYYNETIEVAPSIIQIIKGNASGNFFQQITPNAIVGTNPLIFQTPSPETIQDTLTYLSGRTLFVDGGALSATDTRTGLSKYDRDRPFRTCQAAKNAATADDSIHVFAGNYATGGVNLAKNRVNWYLSPNVKISRVFVGDIPTGIGTIFDDDDGTKNFKITGQGEIYSLGNADNDTDAINVRQNSVVEIECSKVSSVQLWKNAGKVTLRNAQVLNYVYQSSVSGIGNSVFHIENCYFVNTQPNAHGVLVSNNLSATYKNCYFYKNTVATLGQSNSSNPQSILAFGKSGGGSQPEKVFSVENCIFINELAGYDTVKLYHAGISGGTRIFKNNMFYHSDNISGALVVVGVIAGVKYFTEGNIGNTGNTGNPITNDLTGLPVITVDADFILRHTRI